MRPTSIFFALILLLPAPALAEEDQIEKGQAVRLEPDKAYLLVRTRDISVPLGTAYVAPVLYRVISTEEVQQAQALYDMDPDSWQEKAVPNVVVMSGNLPFEAANGGRVMLAPIRPGTYVLGGIATSSWGTPHRGNMLASLCMGTVKFEAKPGLITDLGTILTAWESQPTDIPELAKVVTLSKTDLSVPLAVGVRPADPSTPVPQPLHNMPHAPAEYRAMSALPNYAGAPLTRLAPLPDVLDYDKDGEVIDLKAQSGKAP